MTLGSCSKLEKNLALSFWYDKFENNEFKSDKFKLLNWSFSKLPYQKDMVLVVILKRLLTGQFKNSEFDMTFSWYDPTSGFGKIFLEC